MERAGKPALFLARGERWPESGHVSYTLPVTRILLATNNPGKVREFRRLIAGSGFEAVTPADLGLSLEVAETGSSYEANALLKADEQNSSRRRWPKMWITVRRAAWTAPCLTGC